MVAARLGGGWGPARPAARLGLAAVPLLVKLRDRRDEHPGVWMQGPLEHGGRGTHLDDPAPAQDHRPLAAVVAQRKVVCDEQDPEAARLEISEQVQDVDPGRRVQHAYDLVGNEEANVQEQSPGDQQALELAAAQLVRIFVQHLAGVQAHALERRLDAGLPLRVRQAGEIDAADHAEDMVGLEDRVVRAEGVLEDSLHRPVVRLARQARHVLAVEADRAAGDLGQPQDHPPDRGLAAAALADERDDLAGIHVEAHVSHGRQIGAAERPHPVDL